MIGDKVFIPQPSIIFFHPKSSTSSDLYAGFSSSVQDYPQQRPVRRRSPST
jgi:hypothetical protein